MLALFLRVHFWHLRNFPVALGICSSAMIGLALSDMTTLVVWLWLLFALALLLYFTMLRAEWESLRAQEQHYISIHEAAHAVVAWRAGMRIKAVIIHSDGSGGVVTYDWPGCLPKGMDLVVGHAWTIVVSLAGIAAEREIGLWWHLSCEYDFQKALQRIRVIGKPRGVFGTRMFGTQRVLYHALAEARACVHLHWYEIERFAALLRERRTLHADEIAAFFAEQDAAAIASATAGAKLPPPPTSDA